MHQAIDGKQTEYETPLTHVVCPNCEMLTSSKNGEAVGDFKMNLILGYELLCEHCKQKSFIIYGGHPPLFDIDHTRFLIIWKMPEV